MYASHDLPVQYAYSLPVEGLFRYNTHFVIMLVLLGSHDQHYNEVAVYFFKNEKLILK